MIKLTKLNGTVILMNEDYIETVEEAPDTVITLHDGHRIFVSESMDEISEKIISFRKEYYNN